MGFSKYIAPYIAHGDKAASVRKITVSVPVHVLKLLSDERTRRQVGNLRHATNSDLLCEAFLHAFTGQQLPTDEELKRDMAMKKATKKAAPKKAASKAKKPATKAKASTAKKTGTAKKKTAAKPAKKKAAARPAAKKAAPAKASSVSKSGK